MKVKAEIGKNMSQNLRQHDDHYENIPKKIFAPEEAPNSMWFSKRFLVTIVVCLCYTNMLLLMNNINIAVVEMTSIQTIVERNSTVVRPAEFQWDTVAIGMVSSILWYGGIFAVLGGYFVDKFGGLVSCSMNMLVSGALTIFNPFVLTVLGYNSLLVCRFVIGFFLVSIFICNADIYTQWFPKNERSTLISIGLNGINAGGAIAYPLFGHIASRWGWKMVFYVSGIISVLFSLLCLVAVKNRPTQDKWITKKELSYILRETDNIPIKKKPHPYKKILLSGPVLSSCIGKFTYLWVNTLLCASLPLYVKDLTGKSTDEVGILSSLPTIVQIFSFPICGILLDKWHNTTSMELTRMHKIIIGFAFIISSICFVAIPFFNDFTASMILFIIIQIVISATLPVFDVIIVGISPNDASVIAGLGSCFSCIGGIVSRMCTGFMTINHSSQEWNNCFLLAAGVLAIGATVFIKFASSETQPWSSISSSDNEHDPLITIKYRRSLTDSQDR